MNVFAYDTIKLERYYIDTYKKKCFGCYFDEYGSNCPANKDFAKKHNLPLCYTFENNIVFNKTNKSLTKETICKQFFLTEEDYNDLVKITKLVLYNNNNSNNKKIDIYSDASIFPLYSIMSISLLNHIIEVAVNDDDYI